jgi:hypothetical protein
VVERLDRLAVERQQDGLAARVVERLARLDELDLLDPVGGEDGDLLALKCLVGHGAGLPAASRRDRGRRAGVRE